jgi:hypothetical protein
VPHENLTLMPETDARRALADCRVRLRVLAPVGAYAGRGTLRVLRVRSLDRGDGKQAERLELVCGYEAYEAVDVPGHGL